MQIVNNKIEKKWQIIGVQINQLKLVGMNCQNIFNSSMQQSFANFQLQNSLMSVEEQSPKFQQPTLAQSKITYNPQFEEETQRNYQTAHKRQTSHQYPIFQQYSRPRSPIQINARSQCSSPCCQNQSVQKSSICDCELAELWEEFLETKLMQRQIRKSCHQQRAQCNHLQPHHKHYF